MFLTPLSGSQKVGCLCGQKFSKMKGNLYQGLIILQICIIDYLLNLLWGDLLYLVIYLLIHLFLSHHLSLLEFVLWSSGWPNVKCPSITLLWRSDALFQVGSKLCSAVESGQRSFQHSGLFAFSILPVASQRFPSFGVWHTVSRTFVSSE